MGCLTLLALACGSPPPGAGLREPARWDEEEVPSPAVSVPEQVPPEQVAALLREQLGLPPTGPADGAREGVPAGLEAGTPTLGLVDTLCLAARQSQDYQERKQAVLAAALGLELGAGGFQRASSRLLVADLTRLLRGADAAVQGFPADASVTGALQQDASDIVRADVLDPPERTVVYALFELERATDRLAVDVAAGYLQALRALDAMQRQERLHRWLVGASRRAEREAVAQHLPQLVVERAAEEEDAARAAWFAAMGAWRQQLDAVRRLAGLPADVEPVLEPRLLRDLDAAARQRGAQLLERTGGTGPTPIRVPPQGVLALEPDAAVELALRRRLDLRAAVARLLAADREAERRAGRSGAAPSELAVAARAELEQVVAADVRAGLKRLAAARDACQARWEALREAEAQVGATGFPRADRVASAEVRAAYVALVAAEDAYMADLVAERLAELGLWRDLGVLLVDAERGLVSELDARPPGALSRPLGLGASR